MSRQKIKYLTEKKGIRGYANVFFVIIGFLLVFPFFAVNLRYQLGYIFSIIFNYIGNMCLTFGGFLMILCIVSLFTGRSIKVGWLMTAIVLLWVGCWCSGATLDIMGFTIGEGANSGNSGYY